MGDTLPAGEHRAKVERLMLESAAGLERMARLTVVMVDGEWKAASSAEPNGGSEPMPSWLAAMREPAVDLLKAVVRRPLRSECVCDAAADLLVALNPAAPRKAPRKARSSPPPTLGPPARVGGIAIRRHVLAKALKVAMAAFAGAAQAADGGTGTAPAPPGATRSQVVTLDESNRVCLDGKPQDNGRPLRAGDLAVFRLLLAGRGSVSVAEARRIDARTRSAGTTRSLFSRLRHRFPDVLAAASAVRKGYLDLKHGVAASRPRT